MSLWPLGGSLRMPSLVFGASLRTAGALLTLGALLLTFGVSARPPSFTLASTRVPDLGATLSCLLAVLATTRPALSLCLAAELLTLRVEVLAVLRVALSLLRVAVLTLRVAVAVLWLAPLLILRVELLVERLLAEGAVLVVADDLLTPLLVLAAFIFEEEPLLLLPPLDTLPVAALLLAGEFCTLVEVAELADLLDCPITSIGLTHIITMMRESAIGANFFMTVICLG